MSAPRVRVVVLLIALVAAAGVVAYLHFWGLAILSPAPNTPDPTIPPVSGAHKAVLEAYGACMTQHGIAVKLIFHGDVPGTAPSGNVVSGTGWEMVLPKGVDVPSARFQAADRACEPAGGLYWGPTLRQRPPPTTS